MAAREHSFYVWDGTGIMLSLIWMVAHVMYWLSNASDVRGGEDKGGWESNPFGTLVSLKKGAADMTRGSTKCTCTLGRRSCLARCTAGLSLRRLIRVPWDPECVCIDE